MEILVPDLQTEKKKKKEISRKLSHVPFPNAGRGWSSAIKLPKLFQWVTYR